MRQAQDNQEFDEEVALMNQAAALYLGYQAPALLVYIIAFVLAMGRMDLPSKTRVLTLVGTSVLVVTTVAVAMVKASLFDTRTPEGYSRLSSVVGMAESGVRAVGLGLLVAAIFVGRRPAVRVSAKPATGSDPAGMTSLPGSNPHDPSVEENEIVRRQKDAAMRKVLLVGMGGLGLLIAGVAMAAARWDLSMEGGGKETWLDILPIPLILVGLPVTVIALPIAGITAFTKMAHSRLSRQGEPEPRYGLIIAIFFVASFACLAILYLAGKM